MSFNLEVILREAAGPRGEQDLLRFADLTFSYAQVDDISSRVAASLLGLGLQPGDRVAVQLPNIPQFVFSWFAVLKAGLVMVPLNPLLKAPEVAHHVRDSGAVVLLTLDLFAEEAVKDLSDVEHQVQTFVVQQPGSDERPDGTRHFDELYSAEPLPEPAATNADDTAVIIYTSGTTGRPKGAELTHFQLYMNATVSAESTEFLDSDVGLAGLPLFHVFGLSTVLNTCVRYGGTIVLVPRFEIGEVVDLIERHRVTLFAGVPTMYNALLHADTTGRDLSCLRLGSSGGSAMPGEVLTALETKFPDFVVLEGYGMSETASAATFNRRDARKVMSIGRPMWGVDVRVVDDQGVALPPGADKVGELVVRGHNVMKGYFGNPQATAEAIRAGWLHTGDLGYSDHEGFLFVVDRKKDLVIRGGYNVYPREVEEVLFAHPAVREAAVVGRPHDSLGEEVVAVVSLLDGAVADEVELIEWCKERLAAYKYPREIYVVAELPKGPTGKILKRELSLPDPAQAPGRT